MAATVMFLSPATSRMSPGSLVTTVIWPWDADWMTAPRCESATETPVRSRMPAAVLALAVSSVKRTAALPDVPTTLESGFADSDFDFWVGMFTPKQTPRAIVARIHAETVKALENASVVAKLASLGTEPMTQSPEEFDARVAREARLAVELARAAKIPLQ